jgi:hypothetical protein
MEHRSDDRFRSLNGDRPARAAIARSCEPVSVDPKRKSSIPFRCDAQDHRSSVASNVDIADDARFKFQIIQPVLNHVSYADNASLPLRSTGMWRTRWRVIKCIRWVRSSPRDAVIKPCVMMFFTCIDATGSPY